MANKTSRPIRSIESDLITILEFIRVAVKEFSNTTDQILTHMDLSDDAFEESYLALGDAVDFVFEDDGEDEDDDDY